MFSKSFIQLLELVLSKVEEFNIHKISLGELVIDFDESKTTEKKNNYAA